MARIREVILELANEFRVQTRALDNQVILKCHPWLLPNPCQVVVHRIEPEDTSLISIIRHPGVEDHRVDVYQAPTYKEVLANFETSLKLPAWDPPVDSTQESFAMLPMPAEPGKPLTLRRIEMDYHAAFVHQAKELLFHTTSTRLGEGGSSRLIRELTHIEWHGPLEVNPQEAIPRMIAQAVYDYTSHQEYVARTTATPPPPAPERQEPKWDGAWTCLHPRAALGNQPDATLWSLISSEPTDVMRLQRADLRPIHGTSISYTAEGFIFVKTAELRLGRKVLNHLVYALAQEGLVVRAIGPNDCAQYQLNPRPSPSSLFSTIGMISDPTRQSPSQDGTGIFQWIQERSLRHVADDVMSRAGRQAWHLAHSKWGDVIEYLVDASALADQGRHGASLLTAWTGIERVVYSALDDGLSEARTPQAVRDYCSKRSFGEALRLARDLKAADLPDPKDIDTTKKVRDSVAHRGHEATAAEAAAARDVLRKLLLPRAQTELQSLHRPST